MIGSSYGLTEHLTLRSTSKSACTLTINYKAWVHIWVVLGFVFFSVWLGQGRIYVPEWGKGVHLLKFSDPLSPLPFLFTQFLKMCTLQSWSIAMIKCTSGFMHVNAFKIPRACALMHFANCLWRQRLSFLIKADILIYFHRLVLQTKRCVI